MPIYEYECQKCHEISEVMQKMSDPAPAKCPSCGAKKLQRVMSQTSFQLKGEGWYITDYSKKGSSAKAAKTSEESGSSSSSDSKAASSSDGKSSDGKAASSSESKASGSKSEAKASKKAVKAE